jgi:hypothetical protein
LGFIDGSFQSVVRVLLVVRERIAKCTVTVKKLLKIVRWSAVNDVNGTASPPEAHSPNVVHRLYLKLSLDVLRLLTR